jgi:Ethanolamine utilization protein EutJ (predicted chaperonin)
MYEAIKRYKEMVDQQTEIRYSPANPPIPPPVKRKDQKKIIVTIKSKVKDKNESKSAQK